MSKQAAPKKNRISIPLDDHTRKLSLTIAAKSHISQAAVIRMAVDAGFPEVIRKFEVINA